MGEGRDTHKRPQGNHLSASAKRRGALLVVWIAFIWGHSLIQGPESTNESNLVYELVRPLFVAAGVTDVSTGTFIIRKLAHFSEYAVLGVLARRAGDAAARTRAVLLACVLVPVLDETIQLFVPGRSGNPRDVFIDLAGYAVGALIATGVARYRQKA